MKKIFKAIGLALSIMIFAMSSNVFAFNLADMNKEKALIGVWHADPQTEYSIIINISMTYNLDHSFIWKTDIDRESSTNLPKHSEITSYGTWYIHSNKLNVTITANSIPPGQDPGDTTGPDIGAGGDLFIVLLSKNTLALDAMGDRITLHR